MAYGKWKIGEVARRRQGAARPKRAERGEGVMEHGKWKMENGKLGDAERPEGMPRGGNGKWKMENGKLGRCGMSKRHVARWEWKMEDGSPLSWTAASTSPGRLDGKLGRCGASKRHVAREEWKMDDGSPLSWTAASTSPGRLDGKLGDAERLKGMPRGGNGKLGRCGRSANSAFRPAPFRHFPFSIFHFHPLPPLPSIHRAAPAIARAR
jgi:hypothetical protein